MKITYTSILSAICSSILLLGFLSVYIWKKQDKITYFLHCTNRSKIIFSNRYLRNKSYDRNKNIISRTLSLYAGENRIFKSFFCTFFD